MSFLRIKNEKIYTLVMNQIKSLVVNGELRSGDKLPSEKELTVLLGVSRASIRQAISTLETMGVVEARQGYGTVIAEGVTPESLADLFSHAIVPMQISAIDIVESRLLFECSVAGLCARRRRQSHIDRMRELLASMKANIENGKEQDAADRMFHLVLAEGTGNESVVKLMLSVNRMLRANMWRLVREAERYRRDRVETYYAQHVALFKAIKARDAEKAEAEMRKHLLTVKKTIEEDLSELDTEARRMEAAGRATK